jgi:CubicO group peptidase (beta-lactamase class C family)
MTSVGRERSQIPLLGLLYFVACAGGGTAVQKGGAAPTPPARATVAPALDAAGPAKAKDETSAITVADDTPMTTPSGATYIAPKGWTVTTEGKVVLLQDPNREVSLRFVERKESDGVAAMTAAWKQVEPGFARTLILGTTRPGRDGWDASAHAAYETAVAEERWVWADARRKGDTWHVVLSSGTIPGWGRRGPQAHIARGSYRAPGVVEESFAGRTAHVLDAERLSKLEAFVEQGRRTAQIPGLALAVVQGGKVVFEKGFGAKQLGKQAPVTPNTMFRIASMTKPLTSLMMASLVDDGIFTWDTPVTQILPSFALGDPELTKRLTMRNVLCACTGIPYDNLGIVFQSAGVTAEKMLERMKELKPTTGYGETFQYSNAMIAAAGFLAAHAANPRASMASAYESAMQARIFGPLGMRHTTFDAKKAQRSDHAWPHDRNLQFEIEATGRDTAAWITPMNPGGGAWSTVHDLSQVLLMELAKGKTPEGKQVVSEQNLLARREPQARAGEKVSYGLALAVERYRDVQGYGHGGALAGYTSFMFFLPDHDVGAVMLTNIGYPNPFVHGQFSRKIFELLFDGRDEAREDLDLALNEAKAWRKEINTRFNLSPGKAFFDPFVGRYKHPLYGELKISFDAKKGAWLDVGEWRSRLGKKREEDGTEKLVTTSAPWLDWPEFVRKERDGKTVLEFQDGQRKVILERVP